MEQRLREFRRRGLISARVFKPMVATLLPFHSC
jgi:hypothetical protein